MFNLFRRSITSMVEKQRKIEGEVELLKKQQKVESEKCIKKYDNLKSTELDSIDQQINSFKASIGILKGNKITRASIIDEEKKVELDRIINEFDRKIITRKNQAKRLGHLIEAELKNEQDVINPDQPNSPKPLLEDSKVIKKSK